MGADIDFLLAHPRLTIVRYRFLREASTCAAHNSLNFDMRAEDRVPQDTAHGAHIKLLRDSFAAWVEAGFAHCLLPPSERGSHLSERRRQQREARAACAGNCASAEHR